MSKAHSIAQEDCQCDEPGEPKDGGERFSGEDCELVVGHRIRKAPGHDDEVCESEKRPHRVEDEQVDLCGRQSMPVVSPPVCDCCRSVQG